MQGDLACNDPRRDKNKRKYFRVIKKGDIVTNPNDYERMQKEIIKRAKTCRRR